MVIEPEMNGKEFRPGKHWNIIYVLAMLFTLVDRFEADRRDPCKTTSLKHASTQTTVSDVDKTAMADQTQATSHSRAHFNKSN